MGASMLELVRAARPLPRSITGDGVRETLRLVDEWAPLTVTEVPSGTRVFDWIVPPEWNVRAAWIANEEGERIVDLASCTLHVVGYSEPVCARMTGSELRGRLHSIPDRPDWIPYRTSYYDRTWGFCVSERQLARIEDEREYEVVIDATLDEEGSLTFAEHVIRGTHPGAGELLISTYVCHPWMCNDNLAGLAVVAGLGRWLSPGTLRHDVRLVFAPSTIGALCWLHRQGDVTRSIRGGLLVFCAGDRGALTYKRTRSGAERVDHAAEHVLAGRPGSGVVDFVPWGSDERQFSSPGFRLPVGCLSRTSHGLYAEYHTSADDLEIVDAASLADTLVAAAEIIDLLDGDHRLLRVDPRGEPMLWRHDLEGRMTPGLLKGGEEGRQAIAWVLNLADGEHTLLDVSERSGLPVALVREAADVLLDAELVVHAEVASGDS
jgi:aminopeptidase-like protein